MHLRSHWRKLFENGLASIAVTNSINAHCCTRPDLQYTRNIMDFARATFRVRGDVDRHLLAESDLEAIRIELFDDEVESISAFDPLTGRSHPQMPRFCLLSKATT